MGTSSSITKRPGSKHYQVRLRVPVDLVELKGRAELTRSLRTADRKEAKKLARVVLAKWEDEFEDLRQRRQMTDLDMQAAAVEHYRLQNDRNLADQTRRATPAQIEEARTELVKTITAANIDPKDRLGMLDASVEFLAFKNAVASERQARTARMAALTTQMADGETALIAYAADEFIERHKLTVEKGSQVYRELCHRLARGEIEFLRRTFERDQGNYGGKPSDPILGDLDVKPLDNTTFETIIRRQAELSGKGIGRRKSPTTIKKYSVQLASFAKWRGSTRAATVTIEEVELWRDQLLRTDTRKTVRDKVATVRAVLNWGQAQSKGKLFPKGSPLEHLELPTREQVDSAKKTYTVAQAQKILRAARKQSRPYLRWIPWLLAHTGARVGELIQVEKRDVIRIGSDWFLHIRVEGEERTTKTMKDRKVPIHPAIIAEGFIEFVDKAKAGRLFPETRVEQNLRDWIRERIIVGKSENSPAPNHGFRHLFEDLRFGKISQEAANYITGRANAGSDKLYGKSDSMLPALAEEMRKFPTIMDIRSPDRVLQL